MDQDPWQCVVLQLLRGVEKIISKGKKIAAHMMETTDDKVDFEEGVFSVKGTNKTVYFR